MTDLEARRAAFVQDLTTLVQKHGLGLEWDHEGGPFITEAGWDRQHQANVPWSRMEYFVSYVTNYGPEVAYIDARPQSAEQAARGDDV